MLTSSASSASKCPTKLEKKTQATHERQGNEEHHVSKEEKAQSKRKCYSCRERGHLAHSYPLGNSSKPISIVDNNMLKKDGMIPHQLQLQNIPLLILRLCLSMFLLT